MSAILVPYHLDQHLPGLAVPVATEASITADLPEGDPWQRMAALYERVAAAVADAVGGGGPVTVVSGDCTTSLGTVCGLQRAGLDPSIVWLDAHGDVQTLETTASGYLGGLPLRILVGYRPELIADRLGLSAVAEERVVLVDARDLDPPEAEYLARAAIRRSTVGDVSAATLPDGPVYLHLDLDVVDSGELPGLLFPAPGGPPASAVGAAVRRLLATGRVAAFGVGCTWRQEHSADAAERVRPHLASALNAWNG